MGAALSRFLGAASGGDWTHPGPDIFSLDIKNRLEYEGNSECHGKENAVALNITKQNL